MPSKELTHACMTIVTTFARTILSKRTHAIIGKGLAGYPSLKCLSLLKVELDDVVYHSNYI